MKVDPNEREPREVYRFMIGSIHPRPIAWVSTVSPDGEANLAPFSFFMGVCANPPTVAFSPVNRRDGSKKDTVRNIEANREFVVNVVSFAQAEAMNATSIDLPYRQSEFDYAGLTPIDSERIAPPRVKEAAVQMECVLDRIVHVGDGAGAANLILGRIVLMHVDDGVLGEDGLIDPAKLDTVGRMGGIAYTRTTERFEFERPVYKA